MTDTTRRHFFRSAVVLPILGVPALAVPVTAVAALKSEEKLPPDVRIAEAMTEIERAMAELYPGAHIKPRFHSGRASGAVVIGAHHDPDVSVRFYYSDNSPLLAADRRQFASSGAAEQRG